MFIKKRTKSLTLRVMASLFLRMDLEKGDKKYYFNQKSGYKGESDFDELTSNFSSRYPVLNDLNLEYQKNEFQIDCLIIKGKTLHLYELKNFKGDYFYENGKLRAYFDRQVANPIGQSDRAKVNLHNLVREMGYQYDVQEHIVFIHPKFFMYNAPSDKDYIFLSQIATHLNQLYPYEEIETHQDFIQKLLSEHNSDYRAKQIPNYDYEKLKKGIYCSSCFSFDHKQTRQNHVCLKCGEKEAIVQAIYRSTEEFKLLFPDIPITVNQIYDWCGQVYSCQRIYRLLRKQYKMNGQTRAAYYD